MNVFIRRMVAFLMGAALVLGLSQIKAEENASPGYIVKKDIYERVMPEYRFFWRNTLSAAEQELYDIIYRSALDLEAIIAAPYGVSVDRTLAVLEAVRFDNPELFWLDYTLISYFFQPESVISVELMFYPDVKLIPIYRDVFDEITENVLAYAGTLQTDVEKVKFIHDLLIETNTYELSARFDQSAYSAIVLGESVCMGYSLAFKFYMQRLGIPCTILFDESGDEVHVWNLVGIDGEYYNIDVTWNNPIGNPKGTFSYKYFNITDEQMAAYHVRTGVSKLFPAALGTRYAFDNHEYSYGSDFSALNGRCID